MKTFLVLFLSLLPCFSFAEEPNSTNLPIIFNQESKENASVKIESSDHGQLIFLPKSFLKEKQKGMKKPFPKQIFEGPGDFVSVEDLKKAGFFVLFDEEKVELQILSPSDKSDPKKLSVIAPTSEIVSGKRLKEEPFSGYVNTSLSAGFRRDYYGTTYGDPGRARFDSVLNLDNFILEASGQSEDKRNFRRDDIRLTKDIDLFQDSRISVGDLFFPVRGYQGYRKLGGISLYTTREQKRGFLGSQASGRLLEIKRPSTLTFFVNDIPVTTRKVMPGFYDISDIPLNVGLNQVRVLIEADGTGEREQIVFDEFFSDYGIKKGQRDFAIALGDKSYDTDSSRKYKKEDRTLMVNHRYDFTNSYSLSEYTQMDSDYELLGVINAFHRPEGYIEVDSAGSRKDSQTGGAIRLSYFKTARNLYSLLEGDRYTFSIDNRFNGFQTIDQTKKEGSYTLNSAYTFPSYKRVAISLGYSRQAYTLGELNQNYSIKADRPFGDCFLSLSLQKLESNRKPEDLMVGLTFNYTPGEKSYFFNTQNSENNGRHSQVSFNTSRDQSLHGSVTESEKSASHTVATQITGVTNRAEITFSGDQIDPTFSNQSSEHFNLNTRFAMAFAGNKYAIGRPISDSFVITDAINENRRYRVETWGRHAESGPMGEALLDFQNYQTNPIKASSSDIYDVGYLNPENFYTQNAYKNGYVLTVKEKIPPTVVSLKKEDADIYKLAVIKLKNIKTKEEFETIVSSEGEIFLEDLEVGRYEYTLLDKSGFLNLSALGGRLSLEP